jgi:hypothetical protein
MGEVYRGRDTEARAVSSRFLVMELLEGETLAEPA